jgi:hypothetical protein
MTIKGFENNLPKIGKILAANYGSCNSSNRWQQGTTIKESG